MTLFAIILSTGMGLAAAAQSPTNGGLGLRVGMFQASLVSFFGAFLTLLVFSVLTGGIHELSHLDEVPLWQFMGGLCGAFMMFSVTMSTPQLGVALALTMMMLGNLVGGMVVDGFGLLMTTAVPLSPLRMAGCALVLVGIIFVYMGNRVTGGLASEAKGKILLCIVITFATGVINAVQLPANAALGTHIGALQASMTNFAVGSVVLVVMTMIVNKGRIHSFKGVKPWQFTGGLYGAYGVFAMVTATPILGVSLALACSMFGQLAGGIVVDATGAFHVRKVKINRWRAAGAVVLLAGVVLVTAGRLLG